MRIFITGSADGLGLMAGQLLAGQGHSVVLHARNEQRAADTRKALPGAEAVVVGDLATVGAMVSVADQVNGLGDFDAVIHNAAIGYREPRKLVTADGLPELFAVNSLAPYVLTALIRRPARLIYLSSGLHREGDESLDDLTWQRRRWSGYQAYSDSKLHDVILAFAVARKWPHVFSNALEPGWVATKMGGKGAPDDLAQGSETQAWLAVSDDAAAKVSGGYFFHQRPKQVNPAARRVEVQDGFLRECARLSGIAFPEH
jgi:NAD(P)-dependent dehydrogenase (short-subunit alcohol dehydrogenase family)